MRGGCLHWVIASFEAIYLLVHALESQGVEDDWGKAMQSHFALVQTNAQALRLFNLRFVIPICI